MGEFLASRLRDAFGVIRGFVYQVDLTVDRWLNLRDGESLELEKGEDIDTVVRALNGDEEASRLLEQVKFRNRSLTLRSPEAVEALVNAIEHLEANTNLTIGFQFTTNATAGIERPTPFKNGRPAITAWEDIRQGRLLNTDLESTLIAIKALLAGRPQPEKSPDKSWTLFRAIVEASDNAPLHRLVRAFSWCMCVRDAASIKAELQMKLIALGHAESSAVAINQYQRLFMHVLLLLTQPGLKRLLPQELAPLLALPVLDGDQKAAMVRVFGRLEALEQRLEVIANRQVADHIQLVQVETRIDELARTQGLTAAVTYVAATPTLRPAAPPIHLCRRQETVAHLRPRLLKHTWLELNGGPGVGKSELARLLAESAGGIRAWLDLRGLDTAAASVMFDAAVGSLVGAYPAPRRQAAYSKFVNEIGNGVLVVDDLPRRHAGDPFTLRLLDLIDACVAGNIQLITTSQLSPPTWILERIPRSACFHCAAPPFADGEAREMLEHYSAPPPWLKDRVISTINGAAGVIRRGSSQAFGTCEVAIGELRKMIS